MIRFTPISVVGVFGLLLVLGALFVMYDLGLSALRHHDYPAAVVILGLGTLLVGLGVVLIAVGRDIGKRD